MVKVPGDSVTRKNVYKKCGQGRSWTYQHLPVVDKNHPFSKDDLEECTCHSSNSQELKPNQVTKSDSIDNPHAPPPNPTLVACLPIGAAVATAENAIARRP